MGPAEGPIRPSFSYQVTGEITTSISGRAVVMPGEPAGFVSVNPQTGARTEFAVTPIFLPDATVALAPSMYIGVLGDARVGTYGVYNGSSQRQFYGDFSVLRENFLRRRFEITGGTLTLTKVTSRVIEGRFTFASRVYFDWPRNAEVGTSSTGVPTALSLTGSFVAPRLGGATH
jgi:hypothetical protein